MPKLIISLLATFVAVLALLCPAAATAETRVALIIANSNYASFGKLSNPLADALMIEKALKKVGFADVMVREDLGRDAMHRVLQEFGNKADKADVALIYYAGHGVEIDHVNYLVPVDVAFVHERDVDIEAVKLDTALSVTENAKQMRIVIIDACRTDLVDKMGKSSAGVTSKGLQTVDPTKGLLVWLSAKGNTPAYDGQINSPFAKSLAEHISKQGLEVSRLFNEVRDDVMHSTENKQQPANYGSSQDFYFVPAVAVAAVVAPPSAPTIDIEKESYEICKTALSNAPCESYLVSYPAGVYARLVRMRVADITNTAAANQASVAASVAAIRASLAASMPLPPAASAPVAVAASVPAVAVGRPAAAPVFVASNSIPAGVTDAPGGSVGASRSATVGNNSAPATLSNAPTGFAIVAPPSAPLSAPASAPLAIQASTPAVANSRPPSAPVVAASAPPSAPVVVATAPPPSASVVVATAPPSAPVIVAASPPPKAPVVVASTPPSAPVVVVAASPAIAPVAAASRPAPVVLASLSPVDAPPYAGSAASVRAAPTGFAAARVGDLGITVRYDAAKKAILVESVDHGAIVSGKLFSDDLIMKINDVAADAASAPDTQLAANWKAEGRLKLLVKRGDATSVEYIRSNN